VVLIFLRQMEIRATHHQRCGRSGRPS